MYCLKCGRDTKSEQVFCNDCLAVMDAYPVKPDTAIHLPKRDPQTASKKSASRKKPPTPEEQLHHLKTNNRKLLQVILCLVLLLVLCSGMLAYTLLKPQAPTNPDPGVGKNYTYSPD